MQSALHKSIIDAMLELDESVLIEERNRPDVAPLIAEAMASQIAANPSSSEDNSSGNDSDLLPSSSKKSEV